MVIGGAADSYLSRKQGFDSGAWRANRGEQGPAFQPRTGASPTPQSHNHGSQGSIPILRTSVPIPTGSAGGAATGGTRGTPGGRGSLGHQVTRMEDYRVGELRRGYHHYDPFWRDWYFGYGHYCYDPLPFGSVFSIYYGYYCVPGYFYTTRVWWHTPRIIVVIGSPISWGYCGRGLLYGNYYGYARYDSYSILDRALSDLVDAFKYSDTKALDRLVPRNTEIEIFIDGQYSYSMRSDDYYDATADLINSVYTADFRVENVRKTGNNEFFVVARHDYLDTWNARQSNWLTFTLEYSHGYYRILQAGTSRSRPY